MGQDLVLARAPLIALYKKTFGRPKSWAQDLEQGPLHVYGLH